MRSRWIDKRLLPGGLVAAAIVAALACSSAPAEQPGPSEPAAPAPAQPAQPSQQQPAQQPSEPQQPQQPAEAPTAMVEPTEPSSDGATTGDAAQPQGEVTIAVADVDEPTGIPRFCTAGCAETFYSSGLTETPFNVKVNEDGTLGIEPMAAMEFVLDPSLQYADFKLREGVQFHQGYGEMTSEDMAFSYNDANTSTNPESIAGQAGDFAALFTEMEPIDKYTVRMHYRQYDSRGPLHRFSMFWQTAGITSKAAFEELGVEGMKTTMIGMGPFELVEWTDNEVIHGRAFMDYYGRELGLGPFVQDVRFLEVLEGASRRAMLETGEAQIIEPELKDLRALQEAGFAIQKGSQYGQIENVGFTGNYWEKFSVLTGEELDRNRDISRPWVGNPFEGGSEQFNPDTPSMQNAKLVRTAFAHAIQRQALVDSLVDGFGIPAHQAYLSTNNPNYLDKWIWETDFEKANQLMAEAGYPDGFEMDLWVGTSQLVGEIGESVAAGWQQNLGVNVNLIKTTYTTYRPGLVARSTNTPFFGCGDENKANFPYDWAHGIVMSSLSSGGYGVGMEVPFATEAYTSMAAEPDRQKRIEMSEAFYDGNYDWALCVGVLERPRWSMYDDDVITAWDQRPTANGNLGSINNIRSIKVAQ